MQHKDKNLDSRALEELYVRLEKPLYNVVFRWVWNADDAAEVVQEAFVRLWAARGRVRIETVEPYLFRIAINLASKRRRKRSLLRWLGLEAVEPRRDDAPDASEVLIAAQEQERLQRAIDALPEKLKRVVLLSELSELSYAEIADVLEIPVGTVASRRNAAIKKLRSRLTREEAG